MVWQAVAALAAPLVGKAIEAKGQRDTNAANTAIAREQMEFQQEMSNTAYQRGMEDMRKAGLNPILAYQQGGASAPYGAAIPHSNPWAGSGQVMSTAVNSAMQAAKLPSEVAKLNAEVKKVLADTKVSDAVEYLRYVDAMLRSAPDRDGEN